MLKKLGFTILIVLMFALNIFAASGNVTVLGVWTGNEAEAFKKMIAPFEMENDIKVEFTGTRDLSAILTTRVEAGNPPDVSVLPNPGQMVEFAKNNQLVDLGTFMDMEVLKSDYCKPEIEYYFCVSRGSIL